MNNPKISDIVMTDIIRMKINEQQKNFIFKSQIVKYIATN